MAAKPPGAVRQIELEVGWHREKVYPHHAVGHHLFLPRLASHHLDANDRLLLTTLNAPQTTLPALALAAAGKITFPLGRKTC